MDDFSTSVCLLMLLTAVTGACCSCSTKVDVAPGARVVAHLIPLDEDQPKDPRAIITESEYREALARMRLTQDESFLAGPLPAQLKEAALSQMIERRLVLLEASRLGVRASTTAVQHEMWAIRRPYPPHMLEKRLAESYQTPEDLMQGIEDRLAAGLLLEREAYARIAVTEEEIGRRWSATPPEARFHKKKVHAAQIVVRTEEEGAQVATALRKGGDFAALAKQRSFAPEATRGGDLGWFEPGVMPAVFDDACFSLRPGSISPLTPSDYGYHIFKVLEVESERPVTLDETRTEIRDRLYKEKRREAEQAYLKSLSTRVRVVRDDKLIASIE